MIDQLLQMDGCQTYFICTDNHIRMIFFLGAILEVRKRFGDVFMTKMMGKRKEKRKKMKLTKIVYYHRQRN